MIVKIRRHVTKVEKCEGVIWNELNYLLSLVVLTKLEESFKTSSEDFMGSWWTVVPFFFERLMRINFCLKYKR